jgi:hypothetical protein
MTVLAKANSNLTDRPTSRHPKTGLHSATIVLATFGSTAGSLLAACGAGVDSAIMSAQRNGTQRVTHPAAIAIYKTGNRRTQQVTETTVMQNRNYSAEGTCGRQHWGQQGEHSSRNTQHPIDHSLLLFATPISSNHHRKSASLQEENTVIKTRIGQLMQKMYVVMERSVSGLHYYDRALWVCDRKRKCCCNN